MFFEILSAKKLARRVIFVPKVPKPGRRGRSGPSVEVEKTLLPETRRELKDEMRELSLGSESLSGTRAGIDSLKMIGPVGAPPREP